MASSSTCPLTARIAAALADPTARLSGDLAAHLPGCDSCRRAASAVIRNWPPDRSPSPSLAEWLALAPGNVTVLSPFQADVIARGHTGALELGPYLLLDIIGEGGMGEVYRAWHRLLRREDAVKRLRPEIAGNSKAVRRFLREAEAAANLRHPNVVHVYTADQAGSEYYLAMEFVPGTDLGQLVASGGPLPVASACEFIRQAACGLHHAFTQRLVHRDIKPGNLLVTADQLTVKVADFGLARAIVSTDAVSELTVPGAMLGTTDYMAPEQAEDPHSADTRSDIYSLGCTFFYLLTRQPPFPGGSLREKLNRHATAEVPALAGFRSDVPASAEAVMRKCLAKRPEDRFQTPGELAEALQSAPAMVSVASALPSTAAIPEAVPVSEELPPPEPVPTTAWSNLVEETRPDITPSAPRTSPARRSTRKQLWVWGAVGLLVMVVGVFLAVQFLDDGKPGEPPNPDQTKNGQPKIVPKGEPKRDPRLGPRPAAAVGPSPRPKQLRVGLWKFVDACYSTRTQEVRAVGFLPDGSIVAGRAGDLHDGSDYGWWEAWPKQGGNQPDWELRGPGTKDYDKPIGVHPVAGLVIEQFRRFSIPPVDKWPELSTNLSKHQQEPAIGLDYVAFTANGKSVIGTVKAKDGQERKIRLLVKWDTETGESQEVWEVKTAHDLKVISTDATGDTTATGTPEGEVVVVKRGRKDPQVWNTSDRKKLPPVSGVAITPDGKRVYSAYGNDEDPRIHVWDVDGNKWIGGFSHKWLAYRLEVSPDGNWLLAVGDGVTVWDLRKTPTPQPYDLADTWTVGFVTSAFSADSKRIIAGGKAVYPEKEKKKDLGVVWLWELQG